MLRADSALELIQSRRRALQAVVGKALQTPGGTPEAPLAPDRHAHLLEELQELYWNDLEWENVTEEERMEGGSIPEMTFPGVLALTRGLLLTEINADSPGEAQPRPEVVDDFLAFLGARVLELDRVASGEPGEEGDRSALELRMTQGLLDRVLMEYHRLSPEDVGMLDEA
jgi:hypothetical protein